ncbi:hypothetical protein BC937DRAFT_93775 [Endogone sp. FLAS-F59071]|nr:hypothetical protein BC937DRAFT_93775 [Endogone sp. FLAS-F59071]|eukprot:RUS21046.1 hypothetical protein BC937DRAFT_93775 [Endogone sp. FLAS-F59071]
MDILLLLMSFYLMSFVAASLPQYELRSSDFTASHLEGWFTSNIWSIVIDACEGCSRASGDWKNSGRNNSKVKMLLGRKCDEIVRELGSPEEYAISEEG